MDIIWGLFNDIKLGKLIRPFFCEYS